MPDRLQMCIESVHRLGTEDRVHGDGQMELPVIDPVCCLVGGQTCYAVHSDGGDG
jgi:hypothetical protein